MSDRNGYGTSDLLIYGRVKGKGKFMAFTGDGFTSNLIYAPRWRAEEKAKVERIVSDLNRDNPDYEFEVRRGTGSIYGSQNKRPKGWLFR